jgi:hypothetical protein
MRQHIRLFVVLTLMTALVALALPASADHEDRERTKNLHPMGDIEEPRSLIRPGANPDVHTDLAFRGKYAFQGNWDGFTIRNIAAPGNPKTVSRTFCNGNQGDIVVWRNILVRSWNSPAGEPGPFGSGTTCDGQPVPVGFEGVHVFDISNLGNPQLVGSVEFSARPAADAPGCGSHTVTAVPDPANDRLVVYSSAVDEACPGFDVIEVPADDPGSASYVRAVEGEMMCHDIGVILGDAMKAACAGHHGPQLYSIGGSDGGSLDDPEFLWDVEIPGVDPGHSAAFTWDGEVIVFGWEPGGGVDARCQESSTDLERTLFFFDLEGNEVGRFVFERFQGPDENCTLHNYNIVPLRSGRYVLVHGSYLAGTGVIDFTNLSNPREFAWSDPDPLPLVPEIEIAPGVVIPNPFCEGVGCDIGGAWSSYWYNGFIYESNITEGLNVFRLSSRKTASAIRLKRLNPQTQEFTLP